MNNCPVCNKDNTDRTVRGVYNGSQLLLVCLMGNCASIAKRVISGGTDTSEWRKRKRWLLF